MKIVQILTLATTISLMSFASFADEYIDGVDSAIVGNYRSAYSHWLPLAKQGDARAQFNLALMYHSGSYVRFNEKMAVFWYQKAAENGVPEAQQYMAVGYQEGWFGLPVNENKARYWQERLDGNALQIAFQQ